MNTVAPEGGHRVSDVSDEASRTEHSPVEGDPDDANPGFEAGGPTAYGHIGHDPGRKGGPR